MNREIDANHFWCCVRGSERAQGHLNLLFEKNIYLDDEHDSVLIIGISPQNRMKTSARIEIRSMERVLPMNGDSLINLLECADARFRENAVFPTHTYNIVIHSIDARFYKVVVDDAYFKMGRSALLTLIRKQRLIKNLMRMFERNEYEMQLFRLLHHFCYDASERTVVRALNASTQRHVLDELCDLDCKCLEMSFVHEIALNYSNWFAACVPLFIKTLMRTQSKETAWSDLQKNTSHN